MKRAVVTRLAGPVLHAVSDEAFSVREAVRVGPEGLLGEVVRLDGRTLLVQVYEDTTGLRPGCELVGEGSPLAIRVGPGLLGNIFDGLLQPLSGAPDTLAPGSRGARTGRFAFTPRRTAGERVAAGESLGEVAVAGGRTLQVLVPPGQGGVLRRVLPAGEYAEDEPLAWLDGQGGEHAVAMSQAWPVREPRPIARRLGADVPLVTGQRVLDSLFPVALGGKAAIPGGFGTGKTVLLEALAKGCAADVIVYLGCGERGNEMAGVLHEFPSLTDPRTGRPLMERTVIIANTSNMPVAAREASIYCAVTVAEYFRDMGLDVALMADSTSRWAEALREVSGRFGELPGEGGYPAYLASRLADFYERAARVETLGGRTGSVTVMGAISPPSGDFSEPVTSHTRRFVRSYWALDANRARARFYPAVHPLQSYAEDAAVFAPWWSAQGNPRWLELRRRFMTLLDERARLERMARIIGKDALPPRQQLTLACAELVEEAFLRQSAFAPKDRVAGPAKQSAMMRVLGRYVERAEDALGRGVPVARIAAMACVRPLARMAEETADDELARIEAIAAAMDAEFDVLLHEGEGNDAAAPAG